MCYLCLPLGERKTGSRHKPPTSCACHWERLCTCPVKVLAEHGHIGKHHVWAVKPDNTCAECLAKAVDLFRQRQSQTAAMEPPAPAAPPPKPLQ